MVQRAVIGLVIGLLIGASCGHEPARVPPQRPAAPASSESAPADSARAPLSLARMIDAIDALGDRPVDVTRAHVVVILRRLADTLAEVSRAPASRIQMIRTLAGELERAPEQPAAPRIATALDEALAVLAVVIPARDGDAHASYFAAKEAVGKLDPEASLTSQATPVRTAFAQIARATLALFEIERSALPRTTPIVARDPARFATRAREVATTVTSLGTAVGWGEGQRIAATALDDIAMALAAAPARAMSIAAQERHVQAILLEADRLREADSLSLGRLEWMKNGLSHAVTILEAIPGDDHPASALVRDARLATDAIDVDRTFEFQRTAIQNAARLVSDALRVLAWPGRASS